MPCEIMLPGGSHPLALCHSPPPKYVTNVCTWASFYIDLYFIKSYCVAKKQFKELRGFELKVLFDFE